MIAHRRGVKIFKDNQDKEVRQHNFGSSTTARATAENPFGQKIEEVGSSPMELTQENRQLEVLLLMEKQTIKGKGKSGNPKEADYIKNRVAGFLVQAGMSIRYEICMPCMYWTGNSKAEILTTSNQFSQAVEDE